MKKVRLVASLLAGLLLVSCKGGSSESTPTESASTEEENSEISIESVPQKEVSEFKEISKETIRDKVLGCWIGHALGMGSGFEYVKSSDNWSDLGAVEGLTYEGKTAIFALADKYWEPDGQIAAGSIGSNPYNVHPISDPRVVKGTVYSDDDMHVDILNQFIFRDYGPKLGFNDITQAWKYYEVSDAGGGEGTKNLVNNSNYTAPFCGTPTYGNNYYYITESWIENETLGLTFPFMYDTALGYADMFTQVQGDAYAYYLGKLCAMMYCLAYQYDDAPTCLEKAFDYIPHNNNLWDMYQLIKKCKKSKLPWRDAALYVVKNSHNCAKIYQADAAGFSIDANAGMIFLGIIYGENDFEESMRITSLAGLDGDCTAATVAGLLGAVKGFSNIPTKYQDFLNGNSIYYNHTGSNGYATGVSWGAFAYCGANFPNALTFDQITDLTVHNIENQITSNHGEVLENTYKIGIQNEFAIEQISVNNFSFEDGTADGWTIESSNPNVTLVASESAAHIGTYGGLALLENTTDTAKIYQTVKLTKGNYYKASIWINKCADREFRIFAEDATGVQFKSIVNPIIASKYHMKAELYFTATSDEMKVGVNYVETYDTAGSTTISIDDFIIADKTRTYTTNGFQNFEAEDCTTVEDASVIEGNKFSSNKALYCESDQGMKFNFVATGEVQAFKLYYEITDEYYGTVAFKIDGRTVCNVPLMSTGANSEYNEANCLRLDLFFSAGTHECEIDYISFASVSIDKITVQNSNRLLEA